VRHSSLAVGAIRALAEVVTVLFAVSILGCSTLGEASSVSVGVRVESVQMISNDSVGNEWSWTAEVGSTTVPADPDSVLVVRGSPWRWCKIKATVIEEDTFPDVGRATARFELGRGEETRRIGSRSW